MTTLSAAAVALVLPSLARRGLTAWCQRALLARPAPPPPAGWPPVSILKPLRGLGPDLEDNRRGFRAA